MPELQSLVLTDRTPGTPLNYTFTPSDYNPATRVGTVVSGSGVPIGNKVATVMCKRQPSGRFKARLTLAVPVVQTETISGIARPVVIRTSYFTGEIMFDSSSTTQERKDFMGMIQSAFGISATLVNDAFVHLEGVW